MRLLPVINYIMLQIKIPIPRTNHKFRAIALVPLQDSCLYYNTNNSQCRSRFHTSEEIHMKLVLPPTSIHASRETSACDKPKFTKQRLKAAHKRRSRGGEVSGAVVLSIHRHNLGEALRVKEVGVEIHVRGSVSLFCLAEVLSNLML